MLLKNKANIRETGGKPDFVLTVVTVLLVLFGVVMVYSASSYNAEVNYGNRFFYMYKQIFGAVMGFAAMIALSFIDYHVLGKLRYIILAISVILLVLVLAP